MDDALQTSSHLTHDRISVRSFLVTTLDGSTDTRPGELLGKGSFFFAISLVVR